MTRASLVPGALCLLAVTTLLISCDVANIPDEELRPELVGVVESIDSPGGTEHTFHLQSGEAIHLDSNDVEALLRSAPRVGTLFFSGEAEWGAWYVGLPPSGEDCYALSGPGEMRDDRMVFESGLSLPLGESFDREFFADGVGVRGHVCVNADGEVASATNT